MKGISLCVLLPTRNEEQNIRYMIKEIRQKYDFDIIVSDDHSPDKTREIAKSLGVDVFLRKKHGYGEGLKESLINARKRGHTHMLVIDCDRTYSINGIRTLFNSAKKGYDLVNGGRRLGDINFVNRFPNLFHTMLVNILYFTWIRDVNSGMKLFKIESYEKKIKGSGADSTVETIIIALKNNYRIKEIMLPYNDRSKDDGRGKSKVKISDGFLITRKIFAERFSKKGRSR